MDLSGEFMDGLDDFVGLKIGLIVVQCKLGRNLVLSFCGYQKDRPLHCCKARKNEVEKNEWVLIKSGPTISEDPSSKKEQRAKNEPP